MEATKVHGSIALSQARGVREMSQCKCTWPSGVTEEYGFGLATEKRTYYFHTTEEEGGVRYVGSKQGCIWGEGALTYLLPPL